MSGFLNTQFKEDLPEPAESLLSQTVHVHTEEDFTFLATIQRLNYHLQC